MENIKSFLGGDWTPLEHVVVAVCIQVVLLLCLWVPLGLLAALGTGTAAGIAFFCGREHAQAEDRLRPSLGQTMAERRALLFWQWNRGSQMDLYCPVLATLLLATFILIMGQ